ncbi:MAG: polymer-forming cytoskeletal protein [Alphaproteobacteria bacterium]|nr:polymer-forming cytoskeletal protein [Alphaproteobacteria bacterium]
MRGTLLAAGRIQLDGWFDGELICSELVVGPDGYLFGTATTRTLTVQGQIVGRAMAGPVTLKSGAFFEGEIFHTKLVKSVDATLVGQTTSTRGVLQLPADLLRLEREHTALGTPRDACSPTEEDAKPVHVFEAPRKARRLQVNNVHRLV